MFKLPLLIISFVMLLNSCTPSSKKLEMKNGDILFCAYQTGELSSAIDEVTQTHKATHYSHMALLEITDADTFVIHASLKRGVVKEHLQIFLQIDQPAVVDVYRLSDSLQYTIDEALKKANLFVGLPYNSHYKMTDTCYYCSQLVYEAFKANKVFTLEPMTFKNPVSNEFSEGWIKYYQALGMDIPEGEPGCNPNGLAASNKLVLIGSLN